MTVGLKPTVNISQLSLRSLRSPVPKEPWDTLRKRIDDSARNNGWETVNTGKFVSPHWCDSGNFHVYLHIHLGPDMRAAEKLHEKLWRVDYNVILEEISDGQGTTWKYVQERFIESSGMLALGFPERGGLLVRGEYQATWESFNNDIAKAHKCGGVVVAGQPGIGKSCFLYYLLFRLLSKKNPVTFQRSGYFFVFQEDSVSRYPLTADPDNLPAGTWVLSDSNGRLPCATFLEAASWGTSWIVQTTSPWEQRWKKWKTQRSADIFVMDYFTIETIEEMTVLGLVNWLPQGFHSRSTPPYWNTLGLNTSDLRRNYERWAAKRFVKDPDVERDDSDVKTITHMLFSVRPEEKDEAGRQIQFVDLASDWIKTIVSYAAANARAQKRIKFYETISTQPGFEASAGQIFKGLVLSWLHARPNLRPLHCSPALRDLQIPAYKEKQTSYFGSLTALNEVKVDKLFLSPTSQTLAAVDAIVFTDKFIISVQVAVPSKPSTKGSDFAWADIKKSIPRDIREDRDWRHMYVSTKQNPCETRLWATSRKTFASTTRFSTLAGWT
ncbi:hypothetical protein EDB92DRAFT_1827712 [Lactarius akahatsu]|uniref:Uncharacterized protein n=1 Tax=Lactarius akahatsu TaxID=416441 RepID=A0AAD4LSF1_9AGAM|nr:hypothetical protein EDB92DRAFT_1827712 [Lactarius akahatsu]